MHVSLTAPSQSRKHRSCVLDVHYRPFASLAPVCIPQKSPSTPRKRINCVDVVMTLFMSSCFIISRNSTIGLSSCLQHRVFLSTLVYLHIFFGVFVCGCVCSEFAIHQNHQQQQIGGRSCIGIVRIDNIANMNVGRRIRYTGAVRAKKGAHNLHQLLFGGQQKHRNWMLFARLWCKHERTLSPFLLARSIRGPSRTEVLPACLLHTTQMLRIRTMRGIDVAIQQMECIRWQSIHERLRRCMDSFVEKRFVCASPVCRSNWDTLSIEVIEKWIVDRSKLLYETNFGNHHQVYLMC